MGTGGSSFSLLLGSFIACCTVWRAVYETNRTDISNQVEVADSTKQRLESRDTDDLSLCLAACCSLQAVTACWSSILYVPALAYCSKASMREIHLLGSLMRDV